MTSLAGLQEAARAFCERACGGADGVAVRSPVYIETTEGRDPGPDYSSCGDLPHAMLFALGCRAAWLNRKAHLGFRYGKNIARLCRAPIGTGAGGAARSPLPGELFQTGDVVIAWKTGGNTQDSHVFVVDQFDGKTLQSWDYGQGAMSAAKWAANRNQLEGKRRSRSVRRVGDLWLLDDVRTIHSVLPLAAVFAADLEKPVNSA